MILLAGLTLCQPGAAFAGNCPERPACHGCGCKGGTGYRAPDGHCVGFRELPRVCGNDPAKVCIFENFPNTGLNHDCALGITHPVPSNN